MIDSFYTDMDFITRQRWFNIMVDLSNTYGVVFAMTTLYNLALRVVFAMTISSQFDFTLYIWSSNLFIHRVEIFQNSQIQY